MSRFLWFTVYITQCTRLSHCHYLKPRKHNKELIPKTRTLSNKDFCSPYVIPGYVLVVEL